MSNYVITNGVSGLVAVETLVRKTDNKSTVIATNTRILDVPVIRAREFDYDESDMSIKKGKEFDYDESKGVIDDCDNPDDKTIPVTVHILRESVVSYSKDRLK